MPTIYMCVCMYVCIQQQVALVKVSHADVKYSSLELSDK